MSFTQAAQAAAPRDIPISPIEPTGVLPAGTSKYDALRLVRRLRKDLVLTETDLSVLDALADPTRADDWQDPFRQPINHQMQCEMALRVGIDARSFRRSERRLEQAGLIAKNVPVNGYRSALRSYSMGQAAYGLSLQPLIDAYEALESQHRAIERDRELAGHLRLQIRVLHRKIINVVEETTGCDMDDPLYAGFVAFRASWPRRPSNLLNIEALSEHLDALNAFQSEVVDKALNNKKNTPSRRTYESVASDSVDLRHIQTIRSNTVRCNDNSSTRTDDTSSDSNLNTPPPNGSGEGLEKKCGGLESSVQSKTTEKAESTEQNKPKAKGGSSLSDSFAEMLTPDVMMELISEDWKFILTSIVAEGTLPRLEDFEMAAVYMLRELGISPSAYEQAVASMGILDALLSLIVIDRNRNHPTRPIHNPGGALRAFARRAEAGTLKLQNSIFGLLQREKLN